jgi:hypothetical protein
MDYAWTAQPTAAPPRHHRQFSLFTPHPTGPAPVERHALISPQPRVWSSQTTRPHWADPTPYSLSQVERASAHLYLSTNHTSHTATPSGSRPRLVSLSSTSSSDLSSRYNARPPTSLGGFGPGHNFGYTSDSLRSPSRHDPGSAPSPLRPLLRPSFSISFLSTYARDLSLLSPQTRSSANFRVSLFSQKRADENANKKPTACPVCGKECSRKCVWPPGSLPPETKSKMPAMENSSNLKAHMRMRQ